VFFVVGRSLDQAQPLEVGQAVKKCCSTWTVLPGIARNTSAVVLHVSRTAS